MILHEDRDLLVVDKPAGRKGYSKSRNRIFIVHRLDSAKNVETKFRLQDQSKDANTGDECRIAGA